MNSTTFYAIINLAVTHIVLDYTQIPVAAHTDMTSKNIRIFSFKVLIKSSACLFIERLLSLINNA